MRDRDRDLWSLGPGTFLSHTDKTLAGLDCLSIQRLDALLYTEGKRHINDEIESLIYMGINLLELANESSFVQ